MRSSRNGRGIPWSIVVELQVRSRLERDYERKCKVTVRRLRKAEIGAPVLELALERNGLHRKLAADHVVHRLPLCGPELCQADRQVRREPRCPWHSEGDTTGRRLRVLQVDIHGRLLPHADLELRRVCRAE